MPKVTLILSDLYLPEEAVRDAVFPAALPLPNLEWLLRYAQPVQHVRGWREWLSERLGARRLLDGSIAQCCALDVLPAAEGASAWLATPVHMESRLDHVRLSDRGLLRLAADERAALCEEFARTFGPHYALHDAGERAFLLSGLSTSSVGSVDPARLLDADIGAALPSGSGAREARRLATEIEMWLHGASINKTRERARARRITALWLWGGGENGGTPTLDPLCDGLDEVSFHGGDPYLLALARVAKHFGFIVRQPVMPVPASLPPAESLLVDHVFELAPMSGATSESLAALDSHWFAPSRAALSAGTIELVEIVANDRVFRIAPRPAWRFWRRRQSWLVQLGAQPRAAKA